MKLISLNCWGGKLYESLVGFVKERSGKTDVFCFQEMIFGGPDKVLSPHNLRGQLFERISEVLGQHIACKLPVSGKFIFSLDGRESNNGAKIGQAIFVKKSIAISNIGSFPVYPPGKSPFGNIISGRHTGTCQHLSFKINGRKVTLVNIHGLWQGAKDDTPERLEQSRKILEFLGSKNLPAILIGDFNLRPDTKSIFMLGKNLRNLNSEYDVATTRNRFYAEMEKYKDYIADYAFVSPEIAIKEFQVLKDEVSDHLPLFLDFDLS